MILVPVVDDRAPVAAGFPLMLDQEPDITVCGEASGGRTALTLYHELQPDVVLMDVRMPRVDGVTATEVPMAQR